MPKEFKCLRKNFGMSTSDSQGFFRVQFELIVRISSSTVQLPWGIQCSGWGCTTSHGGCAGINKGCRGIREGCTGIRSKG